MLFERIFQQKNADSIIHYNRSNDVYLNEKRCDNFFSELQCFFWRDFRKGVTLFLMCGIITINGGFKNGKENGRNLSLNFRDLRQNDKNSK